MIVEPTSIDDLSCWREIYRKEMACQIIHDSLHRREAWAQPYQLKLAGEMIGYGSVLTGGPWNGTCTVIEFYVIPEQRAQVFKHFEGFINQTKATSISSQTNDRTLTNLLIHYTQDTVDEKILFEDCISTAHDMKGTIFRRMETSDAKAVFEHRHEPVGDWLLEKNGDVIGTGGIMTHYNPPYGDIYMEVSERQRRKGYGTLLIQSLKSLCYQSKIVPCCRCSPDNEASIKTIQNAGFQPCAHLLTGKIK